MKSGTPELLKFKGLQRRLGETLRGTVGILELLWMGTAKNAPAGDIGRFTDEEIGIMVDWPGDAATLVDVLVESGWLDRDDMHRLVVHDWAEHAPTYIKGNLAKHGREFARPTAKHPARHSAKQPAKQVASQAARDGATKPSQAKPSQATSSPSQPVKAAGAWKVVEVMLRDRGVAAAKAAVAAAAANGMQPDDAQRILHEFDEHPGRYGAGALQRRVAGELARWPPPNRSAEDAAAQAARTDGERAEMLRRDQQRAEDLKAGEELETRFGNRLDDLNDREIADLARAAWGDGAELQLKSHRQNRPGGSQRRRELLAALATSDCSKHAS